jgi:hypothetical protein
MTEFSRRVTVEVFKDEPRPRDVFFAERAGEDVSDIAAAYDRYLHYFQPFWWHAQSPNGEILTNGEHYLHEAGAINSIEVLFGDDTTMYWAPMYGEERGFKLLRYGKTEHKAEVRAARKVKPLGILHRWPLRTRAISGPCTTCPHGWKHHTRAGRCRRSCSCGNGAKRAA